MLQLQLTRDWRFDQQGRPPIFLPNKDAFKGPKDGIAEDDRLSTLTGANAASPR
jgi:hypothetical protein